MENGILLTASEERRMKATVTTLVVPCFNEAERLECDAFIDFANRHSDIRFLFVDDGSSDQTLQTLVQLRRRAPRDRVEVLSLDRNRGKGEAVRIGMLHALKPLSHARVDREASSVPSTAMGFLGYFDADLATPLDEIPRLIEVGRRRKDVAVVVGSRMRLQGRFIDRTPLRRLCGHVFALMASILLGTRIRDTQCGAKLFRVDSRLRQILAEPFMSRWLFDVELLARLTLPPISDLRQASRFSEPTATTLFEYPLDRWDEVAGSKLRLSTFLLAPLELLRIAAMYRLGVRSPFERETVPEPTILSFPPMETDFIAEQENSSAPASRPVVPKLRKSA
ncbi:Poly-beta-1,6-N-acetyl-D-glucosamine synthase [Novipirellula aureliae]|uniref:Poly-beta-1,6-N-acetyl-D-glucosamine synthase n=1 Tax=Novipirellula aureliae TaxID=2527966 RepID=A0A5C6E2U1_9BACT|nr:glycosyltransferase [Novipirellula aureliae]TWU43230.1 Poly-beta-1,6-N-acetyl-D-glucosamine synthase [Novipirellula aureliae]